MTVQNRPHTTGVIGSNPILPTTLMAQAGRV